MTLYQAGACKLLLAFVEHRVVTCGDETSIKQSSTGAAITQRLWGHPIDGWRSLYMRTACLVFLQSLSVWAQARF